MADIVDRHTRSRMMARIRARDTKPELLLRRALRRQGLAGYRCHWRRVAGRPDIAYPGRRIAVFVDGAFWHGHPDYYRGQSGAFWDDKIARNRDRDARVNAELAGLGWTVVRLWDFEIEQDLDACVQRVRSALAGGGDVRGRR